ncbi:MAG: dTDP-glucose 4,6-dehydratase [Candidatus Kapaibacteriales bacterium]
MKLTDLKILVTGGAGFIGSCFIRRILSNTECSVLNIDSLTYAGNIKNLSSVESLPNYSFMKVDIADKNSLANVFEMFAPDIVVNFAAESHVDRSIMDATPFIKTNVEGTLNLLQLSLKHECRYLQVSTDEVYGSLGKTSYFTEKTPLDPRSPYSASKASADMLVQSFYHTFGLDAIITRCSNNYGPYQFPEKLIPLMTINSINDKDLPVYGKGDNIRDWIHVEDHCLGIELAVEKGKSGEVYNFGGNNEKTNLEIVENILSTFPDSESTIKYVTDRLGHDYRYAIDNSKAKAALGFEPKIKFEDGIKKTIEWYIENQEWWKEIISGEYQNYYSKNYENR